MERLSYNNKQKYIIWDTETEGLNLYKSRPWQLAFIEAQGSKVLSEHEYYIRWPNLNIPPRVQAMTHFNLEKYNDLAQEPKEVCEIFSSYIYNLDYINAGHNIISFDFAMFKQISLAANMWNGWSFVSRTLDTLCLSRMYHQGVKPGENLISSQFKEVGRTPRGFPKSTLLAIAKVFKIDVDESLLHNAVEDTKLNHKVLNKLIYSLDI